MENKTIQEWFEWCPDLNLRMKLLKYLNSDNKNVISKTFSNSIISGFSWSLTLEGECYWDLIVRFYLKS